MKASLPTLKVGKEAFTASVMPAAVSRSPMAARIRTHLYRPVSAAPSAQVETSAVRARQARAFSRFPHARIEHHVRDRFRDSS